MELLPARNNNNNSQSSTTTNTTPTAMTLELFCTIRRQTERLCEPLSPEDMMVQSFIDASPTKWHLAHTTWFYETFILSEYNPDYKIFDADFHWLFNSYYNAVTGDAPPDKILRGSFSQPSLKAIIEYRKYVDRSMIAFLKSKQITVPNQASELLILGINHEQQHQELIATDIKHAFWTNPLRPVYLKDTKIRLLHSATTNFIASNQNSIKWIDFAGGLIEIGQRVDDGFAYDHELPRHKVYLQSFSLASKLVTCAEYAEFIQDSGYRRHELWLSEGWETVQTEHWRAPLYWYQESGSENWRIFTLCGTFALEELADTPVCHVSYFEADAFARWAKQRLPTEAEWEHAASQQPVSGNLMETAIMHPIPIDHINRDYDNNNNCQQMYGDVWEWTGSPFIGYPGFQPLPGAIGEYNGKFMSNKMVLRGGSCVTPQSHIRPTYRNFFPLSTRFQFSGIRLAKLQTIQPQNYSNVIGDFDLLN